MRLKSFEILYLITQKNDKLNFEISSFNYCLTLHINYF
jgi:hypothetical protein